MSENEDGIVFWSLKLVHTGGGGGGWETDGAKIVSSGVLSTRTCFGAQDRQVNAPRRNPKERKNLKFGAEEESV